MRSQVPFALLAALVLTSAAAAGDDPPASAAKATDAGIGSEQPIACRPASREKAREGSVLLVCRQAEDDGGGQQQKIACEELVAVITSGSEPKECVASCDNSCRFDAVTRARIDRRLDQQCRRICRDHGDCEDGKQCVLDRVVSKTEVPSCIAAARGCAPTPATPDFCARIEMWAECTCKCE